MASGGEKSLKGREKELMHAHVDIVGDGKLSSVSDDDNESWVSAYGSSRDLGLSGASSHEVDLESGVPQALGNSMRDWSKGDVDKVERDCRICHLSLASGGAEESGISIELGCSCKDDLAAAHKQCAETWFKIKGDKTCEICGSLAQNVVTIGELNGRGSSTPPPPPPTEPEARRFWRGHRLLNFLLGCMVFAFVISWLFHYKGR